MWYYVLNGQRLGPVEASTLVRMANSGQVGVDTPVWTQGMTNWVKLSQSTLAGRVSLPPPAPATAAPQVYGSVQMVAPADSKDRTAYVLLAVFLGIGVHNFYAGYTARGVIQLLLVIFTLGMLWCPVWIWCIIEACTVTRDAHGRPFR